MKGVTLYTADKAWGTVILLEPRCLPQRSTGAEFRVSLAVMSSRMETEGIRILFTVARASLG